MSLGEREKLQAILHECDTHARRIQHAQRACSPLFPLTSDSYRALTEDDIAHLDQLVYRYTKLQDAMGAKLFPHIVAHLREDADSLTVLDKLAHLERAHVISDADRWQELREIRNQLAHDYEDDAETAAGYLNALYESSSLLLSYHTEATQFVRDRIVRDAGTDE
ncbi:MAG: hypothetical protein WD492_06600 [Alkalispirochaeta sp.]